jgi:hypothetical protein
LFELALATEDADLPPNALSFALEGTIPPGVEISAGGLLTWIPDADLSCDDNGCVVTYPDK